MNPIQSHSWDAFSSSLEGWKGDDHSNSFKSDDGSDEPSSLIVCDGNDHSGSVKEKCILSDEVFDIDLTCYLPPSEVDVEEKEFFSIKEKDIHVPEYNFSESFELKNNNEKIIDLTYLWSDYLNPEMVNKKVFSFEKFAEPIVQVLPERPNIRTNNEKDRKSFNEKDRKSNENQEIKEEWSKYQKFIRDCYSLSEVSKSSSSVEKKKWKNKITRYFK
jgi:hypothetical protein